MTINDVLDRFSKKHSRLTLRVLIDDDEEGPFQDILIQGSATALLSLAEILIAVATNDEDHLQIGPFGAGSIYFSEESTVGMYVSRVGQKEAGLLISPIAPSST